MLKYLLKRVALLFVTLFGITVITFLVTRLTPGDPAAMKVSPGGSGGGARSVAGYEDLVEQNRRNLGLDKPWFVNLSFEDRNFMAERALDDHLRSEKMWQDIGGKALQRVNTIALPAALARFEALTSGTPPKVYDSKGREVKMPPTDEQLARLAALFPKLALEASLGPRNPSPAEAHAFWKKWYDENKSRYEDARVRQVVGDYLAGTTELARVRELGGFAVPHLIKALENEETSRRANDALTAITALNFLTSPDKWLEERPRIIERWNSTWRRDKVRFLEFGPLRHGVNVALNTQFGYWMSQVIYFDFGESFRQQKPVRELIAERLPVSMSLSFSSIILAYLIAIPVGIFSAVRRYTVADRTITVILFILYSLPAFWAGTMMILLATPKPFPSHGLNSDGVIYGQVSYWTWLADRLWHMVLPTLMLTYGGIAFISRQMRSAMLETIKQDFVRTAWAKGLSEPIVVYKHALRNSLIPIITISAGLLPELIAGAIITESIFTIRGMGMLTFEAILNRDYPIINAVLFFSAFLTLLGILLADIAYALVDPRISYE